MKRKNSKLIKIASALLTMLMVFAVAGCAVKTEEYEATEATTTTAATTAETTEETTTEEETTIELPTEKITFYLFGCDTQSVTPYDNLRSDLIKVVEIDPTAKTIKFIGILRDTKVPIEGYEAQKINGAYMLGGADLAMSTINTNFGLDIDKYIMINFAATIRLIDVIGGIDVEVTDEEAVGINYFASDFTNEGRMDSTTELTGAGTYTLNGCQALAFARTRKIDSDYFRSARQNKVLKAIINKIASLPVTQYPEIISAFAEATETNISLDDINLWQYLDIGNYEFTSYIVPDENYETDVVGGLDENDSWVWTYDTQAAGERIRSILDGTFMPLDSQNMYGESADEHDGIPKGSKVDELGQS